MDSVQVTATRRTLQMRKDREGNVVLDMTLLSQLPQMLSNADPMHYAQMLPGVQTNNEYQGGIHVEGCDNEHNEVSVEGVPLYNVTHLLGFFSTFNASHYKSMSLTEGVHRSAAPNRLGAQLTMSHGEERPDTVSGELSLGMISSQGTLRLPMGRKGVLRLSGRGSYINLVYKPWMRNEGNEIRYSFHDFNATYVHRVNERHTLLADAYVGGDRARMGDGDYLADIQDRWGNAMGALHWKYADPAKASVHTTLYTTTYGNELALAMAQAHYRLTSRITDVALRSTMERGGLSLGAEAVAHLIMPQRIMKGDGEADHEAGERSQTAWEGSLHGDYELTLARHYKVRAGLRACLYRGGDRTYASLNPSLSVSRMWGNTRFSLQYALRHQYLFQSGFSDMGLPTEFWFAAGKGRRPQYAHGVHAKSETYLWEGAFQLSVGAYVKRLIRQVEYSGTVFDLINTQYRLEDNLMEGKGMNYGWHVMLSKCKGKLTGWVSYAWGRARRTYVMDGQKETYPANHDRTHELNVVATWSPSRHWNIGGTLVMCTGTPFTAPVSMYFLNGNLVTEMDRHNACRLRTYCRVDLSATYKWHSPRGREQGVNLSLYNANCRSNDLFHYVRVAGEDKKLLYYKSVGFVAPVLPSLGYYIRF